MVKERARLAESKEVRHHHLPVMRYLTLYFSASKYTAQLLPRLADLNADASLVGFYASTNNGQHLAMSGFVEALLGAQLNGGGIGNATTKAVPVGRAAVKTPLATGNGTKSGKGIALVFGEYCTVRIGEED